MNKGIHTFLKGIIIPKVNIIAWLEFRLSYFGSPVSCGCRINQLHFCKGVRPSNKFPGYYIKQSDSKAPALEYTFIAIVLGSTLARSGGTW